MGKDHLPKNDFVRERIKDKPVNKKRLLERIGISAFGGAVFGVAACLAIWACSPLLKNVLQSAHVENEPEVFGTEPSSEPETATEEPEDESLTAAGQADEAVQPDEITIGDLQHMQDQLYEIGEEANRAIVIVTSVTNDEGCFNTVYEKQGQSTGVIFKDKKEEYLILTQGAEIAQVSQIEITFIDGSVSEGRILKYDRNTGLAVVAVNKSDMEESAMEEAAVLSFANPAEVDKGTLAIVLGSHIGTSFSILTGSVISTDGRISMADGNYDSFTTDIVSDHSGRGILINTSGQIIGLAMQEREETAQDATLTVVSIMELMPLIEQLASGQDIPYFGVYISTVTDRIAESYGLPKGVYINSVAVDSPAMTGGLQSGDVITQINGNSVLTDEEYRDAVRQLTPGEVCKVMASRQNADGYTEITCEIAAGTIE